MKKLKMNTGLTPFFSGTYETQWEPKEYDDAGNELPLNYSHKDLMKSIAKEYVNHSAYILDELQQEMPFIRKISFPKTFASPREYNFSTDVLDYELTVSQSAMVKFVKGLKDNKEFTDFLFQRYSTRDGFISFTPNNYDSLLYQIEKQDENDQYQQAIAAVMNFFGEKNLFDYVREYGATLYDSIEEHIFDHWQGTGYGGMNYEVDEQAVKEWKERMEKV